MDLDVLVIAGVGFRAGTEAVEIADLIRRALGEAGLEPRALAGIATASDRAESPALREAAALFGLAPHGIGADALAAADRRGITRSERIAALRGVGSLAEAAALAAAGPEAVLALPRIASPGATCALAGCAARLYETP